MPYAQRQGVRLFHTDTGAGDPPLLFVHGWSCDSTHWRAQVRAFRRQHRVVAVDLRGHGRSSKPKSGGYAIDSFCDDLESLIRDLGLHRPVVIGHSMGGVITLELAKRKELKLSGIVMVDPSLHIAMTPEQIAGLLAGLESPAYEQVARVLIETRFFRPTSPQAWREELTERMLRTPQRVMAPALRSLAEHLFPPPVELSVPALFIDAGRTLDELKAVEHAIPGVEIARTNGAGHFNMIEAPEQVNAMLRTFLAQLGAKR